MPNRKLIWIASVAGLVGTASCSEQAEDEGVGEIAMASEIMDVGITPLIAGNTGQWDGAGQLAELAAQCDPKAQRTMVDMCGKSILAEAHFSWTDCTVSLPESAPMTEMSSSGTLNITSTMSGHCERGDFSINRHARIEVLRQLSADMSMRVFGTATSKDTQATSNGMEVEIDIFRDVIRDYSIVASANITAQLSVNVDLKNNRRTMSGTASMNMDHPRGGVRQVDLKLNNIVRVEQDQCRWPVGGSISSSTTGLEQALNFSTDCGVATRDGESVQLDDMTAGRRGPRGRHGGRPF